MYMKKVVLVTGGFDPIHSGHIEYFKEAKKLGNKLIVGVNSDEWLTRKKGKPFMSFNERVEIISNLKMVDQVIGFNDDNDDACHALFHVMSTHGTFQTEIIFANGGDRNNGNTPEYNMYKHQYGVSFEWGVGGADKKNSSSWLLDEWKNPKTEREWGWYRVLDEQPGYKIKELVILPGKSLSNQYHLYRAEHWYVLNGIVHLTTEYRERKSILNLHALDKGYIINKEVWHKAANDTAKPCHVLLVQFGEMCVEEDIVRRD